LALVGLTSLLILAGGCGGELCEDPNDTTCSDGAEVNSQDSALIPSSKPLPARVIPTPGGGGGSMTGVGTPACAGSETSSWGDSSRGGYQYVTCYSWVMIEWGPGWLTSEQGYCQYGVVVASAGDFASIN
ncbi:MAG: hypothetical protein ACOY3Y_05195, partial [Acidobacteriota bacterium]